MKREKKYLVVCQFRQKGGGVKLTFRCCLPLITPPPPKKNVPSYRADNSTTLYEMCVPSARRDSRPAIAAAAAAIILHLSSTPSPTPVVLMSQTVRELAELGGGRGKRVIR